MTDAELKSIRDEVHGSWSRRAVEKLVAEVDRVRLRVAFLEPYRNAFLIHQREIERLQDQKQRALHRLQVIKTSAEFYIVDLAKDAIKILEEP